MSKFLQEVFCMINAFRQKMLTGFFVILSIVFVLPAWGGAMRGIPNVSSYVEELVYNEFIEICENGTEQEILDAINNGRYVNGAMNKRAYIDARGCSPDGITTLMWASMRRKEEIVKALLNAGADVNATTYDGRTALMFALTGISDAQKVAVLLLDAGADVSIETRDGRTAFDYAKNVIRDKGILRRLAPAIDDYQFLDLCRKGTADEILEAINMRAANVNGNDLGGQTALIAAAMYGNLEAVKVLLKAGADVNAKTTKNIGNHMFADMTALMFAAWYGHVEIVKTLLDAGADVVDVELKNGLTARDLAKFRVEHQNGNPEILRLLENQNVEEISTNPTTDEFNEDELNDKLSTLARDVRKVADEIVAHNKPVFEVQLTENERSYFDWESEEMSKTGVIWNRVWARDKTIVLGSAGEDKKFGALIFKTTDPQKAFSGGIHVGSTAREFQKFFGASVNTVAKALNDMTGGKAAFAKETFAQENRIMITGPIQDTEVSEEPLITITCVNGVITEISMAWNESDLEGCISKKAMNVANKKVKEMGMLKPNKYATENLLAARTPEQVKALINAGADVNAKGRDDWTPLMFAAMYSKNPEIIKILLDAGANVNAKTNNSMTALMLAAASGADIEVIGLLLNAGANVHAKGWYGEEGTALMFAAMYNKNPEVIRALLNAGSDVNVKNSDGNTAVDFARHNSNEIRKILENAREVTPKISVKSVLADVLDEPLHVDMSKVASLPQDLIDRIEINFALSNSIETYSTYGPYRAKLLMISSSAQKAKALLRPERIRELIEQGDDIDVKAPYDTTLLMLASAISDNPEVIKMLLNAGVDVNARAGGYTALMFAAYNNTNPKIIKILLNAGANVNTKFGEDEHTTTALTLALEANPNPEVIKILRNADANVSGKENIHSTGDYNAALILAAASNTDPAAIKELLNSGADVNAEDNDGNTALMEAAMKNTNPEIIRLLLEAGAYVNANSRNGNTALNSALTSRLWVEERNPKVIKLLLDAGAEVRRWEMSIVQGSEEPALKALFGFRVPRDYLDKRPTDDDLFNIVIGAMSPEQVEALIRNGGYINAGDLYGNTLLTVASAHVTNPEIIKVLLKFGADVNAKSQGDWTALMSAAYWNENPEILRVLLDAGADINARDSRGNTAENLVKRSIQHADIVQAKLKILKGGY